MVCSVSICTRSNVTTVKKSCYAFTRYYLHYNAIRSWTFIRANDCTIRLEIARGVSLKLQKSLLVDIYIIYRARCVRKMHTHLWFLISNLSFFFVNFGTWTKTNCSWGGVRTHPPTPSAVRQVARGPNRRPIAHVTGRLTIIGLSSHLSTFLQM